MNWCASSIFRPCVKSDLSKIKLRKVISSDSLSQESPTNRSDTCRSKVRTFLHKSETLLIVTRFGCASSKLHTQAIMNSSSIRYFCSELMNRTRAQRLRSFLSLCLSFLKFLIPDRDNKFGESFIHSVRALGIRSILAAYRSPWQDGFVERLIGSFRRECLDHLIIANENHLRKSLKRHSDYYQNQRTHLGLNKDSPEPRRVDAVGKIERVAVANGLRHFHYRSAA